jgi:hypothetical protein
MKRRSRISAGQEASGEDTPAIERNNAPPSAITLNDRAGESWIDVSDIQNGDGTSGRMNQSEEGTPTEDKSPPPPPPKEIPTHFIPRFKGAAEMEARRKIRMLARRQAPGVIGAPPRATAINPELSSSDEEGPLMSESEDEDSFHEVVGGHGGMDDADEFDP